MKKSKQEIFLSHVVMSHHKECWIWIGGNKGNGYGSFNLNGKTTSAHRASYILFVSDKVMGFDVCHKCDVRSCVNPMHLFLGTRKENMEDAVRKGRQATRKNLPQTKISEIEIPKVMRLVRKGILYKYIAKQFNVTRQSIGKIAINNGVRRYVK